MGTAQGHGQFAPVHLLSVPQTISIFGLDNAITADSPSHSASSSSGSSTLSQGGFLELLDALRSTDAELEAAEGIKQVFSEFLSTLVSDDSRILPYGSRVTDLALPGQSDFDFSIIFPSDIAAGDSRFSKLKRLRALDHALYLVADMDGSYNFVRTARVPIIRLTVDGIDFDISVNSTEAEQVNEFILAKIASYPAYKDVILLMKYILTVQGCMDSSCGGMSSFILSLVVLYYFEQVLSSPTTSTMSEDLLLEFLAWFSGFPFDQRALVIGGEDVARICWKHAMFIHPFLNVESTDPKRNLAASLQGEVLFRIQSYIQGLLGDLRNPLISGSSWAQFLPLPPQMSENRHTLQDTVASDFKRRLFDPPRDRGAASSSLKRRAMDGGGAPSAKRGRFTHPSETMGGAPHPFHLPYIDASTTFGIYSLPAHPYMNYPQYQYQQFQGPAPAPSSFAGPHSYSFSSPLAARAGGNRHSHPPHPSRSSNSTLPARPVAPLPRRPTAAVDAGNPLSGGVRLGGGGGPVPARVAKSAAAPSAPPLAVTHSGKTHSPVSLLSRIGPKVTNAGTPE